MRQTASSMRRHLDAFSNSELTVARYCQQHDLSVATFYYWRRKLVEDHVDDSNSFCQLVTTGPSSPSLMPILRLPSGLQLELSGFSLSEIASIILEIESARA